VHGPPSDGAHNEMGLGSNPPGSTTQSRDSGDFPERGTMAAISRLSWHRIVSLPRTQADVGLFDGPVSAGENPVSSRPTTDGEASEHRPPLAPGDERNGLSWRVWYYFVLGVKLTVGMELGQYPPWRREKKNLFLGVAPRRDQCRPSSECVLLDDSTGRGVWDSDERASAERRGPRTLKTKREW